MELVPPETPSGLEPRLRLVVGRLEWVPYHDEDADEITSRVAFLFPRLLLSYPYGHDRPERWEVSVAEARCALLGVSDWDAADEIDDILPGVSSRVEVLPEVPGGSEMLHVYEASVDPFWRGAGLGPALIALIADSLGAAVSTLEPAPIRVTRDGLGLSGDWYSRRSPEHMRRAVGAAWARAGYAPLEPFDDGEDWTGGADDWNDDLESVFAEGDLDDGVVDLDKYEDDEFDEVQWERDQRYKDRMRHSRRKAYPYLYRIEDAQVAARAYAAFRSARVAASHPEVHRWYRDRVGSAGRIRPSRAAPRQETHHYEPSADEMLEDYYWDGLQPIADAIGSQLGEALLTGEERTQVLADVHYTIRRGSDGRSLYVEIQSNLQLPEPAHMDEHHEWILGRLGFSPPDPGSGRPGWWLSESALDEDRREELARMVSIAMTAAHELPHDLVAADLGVVLADNRDGLSFGFQGVRWPRRDVEHVLDLVNDYRDFAQMAHERSHCSPSESSVPCQFLSLYRGSDPDAAIALLALGPRSDLDPTPIWFRLALGGWVEDPTILRRLAGDPSLHIGLLEADKAKELEQALSAGADAGL